MTRRDLLSLTVMAPFAPFANAAGYRAYSRCLPDYLTSLARDAYKRRNAAIAALKTPDSIRSRQAWVRETFWKLAGGQPERTPLNVRTTGSFEREGYRLEKLVYESQPGLHIAANLYVPTTRKPPFPGVLFHMGHSLNGKAADSYQKCCQGLARLGYLVLAIDPMGQGERTYYPKPGGTLTRLGSADDEHSIPGQQMLLVGDSAVRMQTWDAVRSLDVLAAHPSVDPKRLASTGQSGGATVTMLLAAVDERLAAAAVSSGNTENFACADFNPPGSVDDAEQDFVGSGPAGFDRWDTLYPLAPKPLLVLASLRDYFGTYSPSYLTSGHEEFGKLKQVYAALGHADRLEWGETPLPHGLSLDMRLKVYDFFERWLQKSGKRITEEPPVKPEPEEALYVGPTGNVVRDFGGKTPYLLAREAAARLKPDHRDLASILGIDTKMAATASLVARANGEACHIDAIDIPSAPGVSVPAYLYVPKAESRSVLLVLEPNGRTPRWKEGDLYHRLAAEGLTVCAFDVRGIGDLSPEVGRGNPAYTRSHSDEESYAWASLILGRPLLGQRVTDILAVAKAMRSHPAGRNRRLILAARGHMTVPAMFAAALDPAIDVTYLAGGLPSFASLLDSEEYKHPFSNFVPDILKHTDLPEIAASLGNRLRRGKEWNDKTLAGLQS